MAFDIRLNEVPIVGNFKKSFQFYWTVNETLIHLKKINFF